MKTDGTTYPAIAAERVDTPPAARSRFGTPRTRGRWTLVCFLVDAAMLAAAVAAAALGGPSAGVALQPAGWLIGFSVLVLVLFRVRGMYRPRLRLRLLDDLRLVVACTAIAAMTVVTLRILVTDDIHTAQQVVRSWLFATVYLLAGRSGLYLAQTRARIRGDSLVPTLIIGAGQVGRLVARRLSEDPAIGLRPVGFLDKQPRDAGERDQDLPVLGASWDLEAVVAERGVQHAIVTFSTAPHQVMLDLVRRCQELGVRVSLVPRLFENLNNRVEIEYLGGLPLLEMDPVDPKGWQFDIKYALDRVMAAVLLVLLSPLLLVLVLAVKLSSRGPVLYRQRRVGVDGHDFQMLKFRSMRLPMRDNDDSGTDVSLQPDTAPGGVLGPSDRRTGLGTLMRRFSIDELPQLLNVLRGDMSFVGPRPERPAFVERFEQVVYRYSDRHRVKSGITGWAQVNGLRGQTSLADRIEWDNYYIESWSFWLDIKIAVMTFAAVLQGNDER